MIELRAQFVDRRPNDSLRTLQRYQTCRGAVRRCQCVLAIESIRPAGHRLSTPMLAYCRLMRYSGFLNQRPATSRRDAHATWRTGIGSHA